MQSDDIFHASSPRGQGLPQILKHLLELSLQIVFSDEISPSVQREKLRRMGQRTLLDEDGHGPPPFRLGFEVGNARLLAGIRLFTTGIRLLRTGADPHDAGNE